MTSSEKYLRPEVIRQVARLDLRAKFIVEGFLTGLHASPFQGFSVEFAEHRKYNPGDDLKTLDWNVYAKTGKYFVKKFRAETNMTGHLVLDTGATMGWCGQAEVRRRGLKWFGTDQAAGGEPLSKLDYAICLAAALGYLMVFQQDPVGLATFDAQVRAVVPPRSKRTQLGTMLSVLANAKSEGTSDVPGALARVAGLTRGKSLVILFSDLLPATDDWRAEAAAVMKGLHRLRYAGHEVIVFHVLDEAEARFPLGELITFQQLDGADELESDARGMRDDYLAAVAEFRDYYKTECTAANVDFVPMDTGVGFDKGLLDYLQLRQRRFG